MPGIFKALLLFLVVTAAVVPVLLWIYQIAQFGDLVWDLNRMAPEKIVAVGAKGVVASALFCALAFLGMKHFSSRYTPA